MIKKFLHAVEWRRIIVESGAVVLSILLAFSIDALWGRHQDRVRENTLIKDLLADYSASRSNLVERIDLANRMVRNTLLLQEMVSTAGDQAPVTVPDSLILGAIGGPTYEPVTNTLDAAMSSGEIELIQSKELKAGLANWRRMLFDTTEDEVEVRRLTNEQLIPSLGMTLDLGPYFVQLLNWSMKEPVTGLPGRVTLQSSTEIASLLGLRYFYQQFAATDLTGLLTALDDLVILLEKEIQTNGSQMDIN